MLKKWSIAGLGLFALTVSLTSCDPAKPPLPEGIQEVTGTVEPAPLSRIRRGTHFVMIDGTALYYLESPLLNLRDFEGSRITVRGLLEENTESDTLPVLIVSEIAGHEVTTRLVHAVPQFGLTLEVPASWKETRTDSTILFSGSGSASAILTVRVEPLADVPFDDFSAPETQATLEVVPIIISSKRALRITEKGSIAETVHIDRGEGAPIEARVITLRFTPQDETQKVMHELFLRILHSVKFGNNRSSESFSTGSASSGASNTSQAAASGKPCGGPAGILCDSSEYCAITDLSTNFGVCKKR